jgi:hypothetical protein
MKIRTILLALLAVAVIGVPVSSGIPAIADTVIFNESGLVKCRIPPFKEAYRGASSVFTGTITEVVQNERGKTFEFQVEKYWKGSSQKKVRVTVYETSRYQAFYQTGKKYLVFASADDEGGLRDGRCSRSGDIAGASADLKALGKGKRPR